MGHCFQGTIKHTLWHIMPLKTILDRATYQHIWWHGKPLQNHFGGC